MSALKSKPELMEMTKAQIREYADVYAGLHLPSSMKKEEMADLLVQVSSKATHVADIVPKEERQDALKKSGRVGTGPAPGRIRIIIARDGMDKRQRPVFLGHKQDNCLVKRGVECDVLAKFVVASLNDAIEKVPVWDDEVPTAVGYGDYVQKEQHSYPYSIIQFGPETEWAQEILGYGG